MRLSELRDIRLTQTPDRADLWWVTIDERPMVGFGGPNARARAERYVDDLLRIAQKRPDHEVPHD